MSLEIQRMSTYFFQDHMTTGKECVFVVDGECQIFNTICIFELCPSTQSHLTIASQSIRKLLVNLVSKLSCGLLYPRLSIRQSPLRRW